MLRLLFIAMVLMATGCSEASSGCSKEETLKLINAGYTKTEISGLCNQAEKRESTNQKSSVVEEQSESGPSPDELFENFKKLAEYSSDNLVMDYEFTDCNFYAYRIKSVLYNKDGARNHVNSGAYFFNLKNVDVNKSQFSNSRVKVVFPRGYYGVHIRIFPLRFALKDGSIRATNMSALFTYKRTVTQVLGLNELKDHNGMEDKRITKQNHLVNTSNNTITLGRALYIHGAFTNDFLVPDAYEEDASEIVNAFQDLVKACAKMPRSSQSQTSTKSKPSGSQVADHTKGGNRFSKDKTSGIITDSKTDLEWMMGPDKDTDYYEAEKWIASQGKGWRMPTRQELKSLYQKGVGKRNIDPAFKTTGWHVWAEPDDSSSAWYISFGTGEVYNGKPRDISPNSRMFAVRSNPSESQASKKPQPASSQSADPAKGAKRFSKDKTSGVISDSQTGLEWMNGPDKDTDYYEAEKWVTSLGERWRMPTRQELKSLYQKGVGKRNLDPVFQVTGSVRNVWADGPTDNFADQTQKWVFDLLTGHDDAFYSSYAAKVRAFAVRSRPLSSQEGAKKPGVDQKRGENSATVENAVDHMIKISAKSDDPLIPDQRDNIIQSFRDLFAKCPAKSTEYYACVMEVKSPDMLASHCQKVLIACNMGGSSGK